MCWMNISVFSLVTKACEKWIENSHFSSGRHFRMCIPKVKTITFFRRKLSKLHEKDTILHVTSTFFLKQGQTRASSGPITVPLSIDKKRGNAGWYWYGLAAHVNVLPMGFYITKRYLGASNKKIRQSWWHKGTSSLGLWATAFPAKCLKVHLSRIALIWEVKLFKLSVTE